MPLPPAGAGQSVAGAPPGAGRRFLVRAAGRSPGGDRRSITVAARAAQPGGGSAPTATGAGRSTAATTPPSSTPDVRPRRVALAAADYVGQPVAQVQAALVARGAEGDPGR